MWSRFARQLGAYFLIGSIARAQDPLLWELVGPADSGFGLSVGEAGDLDSDGMADVIVGEYVVGPIPSGAAKVFSGVDGSILLTLNGGPIARKAGHLNGDGVLDYLTATISNCPTCPPNTVTAFSGADGSMLYMISSGSVLFGWSLAAGGDVDGDGVPDFIVGDPAFLSGPSFAHIYSGATGTLIRTLSGGQSDSLGISVAGIGDVNLDDVPEFIAAGPQQAFFGNGHAYVFSGATGEIIHAFPGSIVAGAGRVDADSIDDVIVAVPTANSTKGMVRLFSGASGNPIRVLKGTIPAGFFGRGVARVGDVTGDGSCDLVVGTTLPDTTWRATVYSGATGNLLFAATGNPGEGDAVVAAAGDVNGDGVPDLALGLPGIDRVRIYSLAGLVDIASARGRTCLQRSVAQPDPDARGKVQLRLRGIDQFFRVDVKKLEGSPTEPYAVFIEDAPGSGIFLGVGPLTLSSAGCWSMVLSSEGAAPAGLGAYHVASLEGRIVEIRSPSGGVYLHALLPDLMPGPDKVASAALSPPSSPITPGVAGLLECRSRPKKGSQRFALKTSGLAAGPLYSIHIEDALGSGNFVAAGDLANGRFLADTKRGAPLPLGVLTVTDLSGRAIQIREGSTIHLEGLVP